MHRLYLLASDQRFEAPTLEQIVERIDDPVFELCYQSEDHNSTLTAQPNGIGEVAFRYCEHEQLEFGQFFYEAKGSQSEWISVWPEDSPELVTFHDGQDDTTQPRMFYVSEDCCVPVLQQFCESGTRSDRIKWEIEDEVMERLADQGVFDEL